MDKKELYQRAINQWGETAQISMAVEECSEFITTITKLYRKHNGSDANDVMGEIADVENSIEVTYKLSEELTKERKRIHG